MIEINLVPDVKQELIKAQRARTGIISMSIVIGIAAVGVVVLLVLWVFAVQTARGVISDGTIKSESGKLAKVPDISHTLTIQNQLAQLSQMHDDKHIDSRIFDILNTINPPDPNTIAITTLSLDSETNTVKIEAQAKSGYPALDVFKKTISATTFQFTQDGENKTIPLASNMSDTDRSYGEDATGTKVLRFALTFTYPNELFSRLAQNARVVAPTKSNVTDSYLGVPNSLFTQKAADTKEDN
jgi:Tfp pilus assembly protein PilN